MYEMKISKLKAEVAELRKGQDVLRKKIYKKLRTIRRLKRERAKTWKK